MHYHYPHGTGSSYTWGNEGRRTYPLIEFFFFPSLIAAQGFAQLRFSQWFKRDTSKILLRVFLFTCVVMVAGMWAFALANHFWTLEHNHELRRAEPYMRVGTVLFRIGFWSAFATSLSNMVYAVVRKRRA